MNVIWIYARTCTTLYSCTRPKFCAAFPSHTLNIISRFLAKTHQPTTTKCMQNSTYIYTHLYISVTSPHIPQHEKGLLITICSLKINRFNTRLFLILSLNLNFLNATYHYCIKFQPFLITLSFSHQSTASPSDMHKTSLYLSIGMNVQTSYAWHNNGNGRARHRQDKISRKRKGEKISEPKEKNNTITIYLIDSREGAENWIDAENKWVEGNEFIGR